MMININDTENIFRYRFIININLKQITTIDLHAVSSLL